MKIILMKKKKNLGNIGDIVFVKSGYARNFLFPKGYALEAIKKNILLIKKKKDILIHQKNKKIKEFKNIYYKLKKIKFLSIYSRISSNGKLFGSITFKDVIKEIINFGILDPIKKNHIFFPNGPIKNSGNHVIYFNPHKKINLKINIKIISKNSEKKNNKK